MKKLSNFNSGCFFFGLAFLGKVRQGTNCHICLSLTITNLKVVLRKFLGPADLKKTRAFSTHKLVEIIIISEDENLVFTVFQIVAPSF